MKVDFVTDDRTVVMPEEIKVDQGELVFDLILTRTGSRYNPADHMAGRGCTEDYGKADTAGSVKRKWGR